MIKNEFENFKIKRKKSQFLIKFIISIDGVNEWCGKDIKIKKELFENAAP
ncbi:hypothetical protein OBK03_10075 [Empedobacter falsenii]